MPKQRTKANNSQATERKSQISICPKQWKRAKPENTGKWRENLGFCWWVLTPIWCCLLAVVWVMVCAHISPNPQIKPELMIWVFTGCTAKQSWYHFHSLNSFILQREGIYRENENGSFWLWMLGAHEFLKEPWNRVWIFIRIFELYKLNTLLDYW